MLARLLSQIATSTKIGRLLKAIGIDRPKLSRVTTLTKEAYRLYENGSLQEAEKLLIGAVSHCPDEFEIRFLLADTRYAMGKVHDAIEQYQIAARIQPEHAALRNTLGLALVSSGRPNDGMHEFSEAVRLEPGNARYWNNLAMAHIQHHQPKAAWRYVEKALKLDPMLSEAWCNKGILLQEFGRGQESIACFEKAVALDPTFVAGWSNLGLALKEKERYQEAVDALNKAIHLNPDHADSLNNLAATERERGNTKLALEYVSKALRINPALPQAHCNFGGILQDMGRLEEASNAFRQALSCQADFPDAKVSLGLLELGMGRFSEGWALYEDRKQTKETPLRNFPYPQWGGETIDDKTVLIYAEQGLGDEIMFASCFHEIIARAKSCYIECDPRLAPLFSRSFGDALVWGHRRTDSIAWLDHQPPVDVQLPAGSLPRFFRNEWSAFPAHQGYLRADSICIQSWREKLDKLGAGLKIGIAWRGGIGKTRRHIRSIPLREWSPILTTPDCHFISLQYGVVENDFAECAKVCGKRPHHWEEAIADIDELAGLISSLDLVISVCNSWVHLGGALGKPVWVLVPQSPEWRYMFSGERIPWYPSVRLYRQQNSGQWRPLVEQVQENLMVLSGSFNN